MKINIYSINDLMYKDFDDEEINQVTKSLIYSLIIGMFRFAKYENMSNEEIINIIKKDNSWVNKFKWTRYKQKTFIYKLNKIFYNLYRFNKIKCENSSIEFIMKYGLKTY